MIIVNKGTSKNSAIHKVLDILLLFQDQRHLFSVEDISQELDIPRSTVYRYIRILCEKGLLERTETADYRPGIAFIELGRSAIASNRELRLIALPNMQRIAEAVGESVSLMRLYNRRAVCIESIEGQQALRVTIERGRTQPLHAGASSKILLAYLPEDQWEEQLEFPLARFTHTTITDFDALRTQLHAVRDAGYCISNGEIDVGARALAVPLFDGRDEIVAALSIEAPASRMDDAIIGDYLVLLQREAEHIYRELS